MNSKPLPPILNAAVMREHACEGETQAIRIILLNSVGATLYTLRGQGRRKGKYILEKSGASGRHQLDVPVSVWNRDLPKGRYHDNPSIAHDLLSRPNPMAPFALQIVPWNSVETSENESLAAAPAVHGPDFFTPLVALIKKLGAPSIVDYALSLAIGDSAKALEAFVATVPDDPSLPLPRFPGDGIEAFEASMKAPSNDAPPENIPDAASEEPSTPPQTPGSKAETPAARRMREKRARDRAKREAAKLQTA